MKYYVIIYYSSGHLFESQAPAFYLLKYCILVPRKACPHIDPSLNWKVGQYFYLFFSYWQRVGHNSGPFTTFTIYTEEHYFKHNTQSVHNAYNMEGMCIYSTLVDIGSGQIKKWETE